MCSRKEQWALESELSLSPRLCCDQASYQIPLGFSFLICKMREHYLSEL